MSAQRFRRPDGGLVDRRRPLRFSFDGRPYDGYAGDTLASALLANGVRLVGRSFKYHRPRGIFGVGAEEPNALVRVRSGARAEPNLRATQVELHDGLVAASQNRWPSLALDVGAATGLVAPLLPAGFYYKTFMGPGRAWPRYEPFIRRAAGLGRVPERPDPDRYEHRHHHCDVLVIGAGPAGLSAALAAGARGARVLLADEGAGPGGTLRGASVDLDGGPAMDWAENAYGYLGSLPGVRVLARTTAFGYYDQNLVALAERVADHRAAPGPFEARQRLWQVRAREVVLATGSIERPMVFDDNDRPGVMLASAVRAYANQYGVRCGRRAVLFTNNDSAYAVAREIAAAGIEVAAVVDTRESGPARGLVRGLRGLGIESLCGYAVTRIAGRARVRGVEVRNIAPGGDACFGAPRLIPCDLVGVAGGWNPTVHLFSQSRGRLAWSPALAAFVPGESAQPERSAGAANGTFPLAECFVEGLAAGAEAAAAAGFRRGALPRAPICVQEDAAAPRALWAVPAPPRRRSRQFVDFQNDVTVADVALAAREGYDSVELLKRYTTLGMGTDQGRTSNVAGLALLAAARGHDIPRVGTTTFRPPYTPVTLGLLAGHARGSHLAPVRRTPLHGRHLAAGAHMVTAGLWMRPQYYPRAGEDLATASRREARAVRAAVGMVDVSTLGKIEVQGRDAAEFLERVYANRIRSLAVGRCRYGIMLREDGHVMDDGTITRLEERHYYLTTTTARAEQVMAYLERHAQVTWPGLDVYPVSVSDQWAGIALAGPESRRTLARAAGRFDIGNDALPFLGYREARIAGAPVRIFRITYSGELAYEIHVPGDFAGAVWDALLEAGEGFGIVPYGTEAMGILRVEKGHAVIGAELDGRTTPADMGLGRMVTRDGDYIGKRSLDLPALRDPGRPALVGLLGAGGGPPIPGGAQLMTGPDATPPADAEGHVTSTAYSPHVGAHIALALIAGGAARHGERVYAVSSLTGASVPVTVTGPVFVDPEGGRPRG